MVESGEKWGKVAKSDELVAKSGEKWLKVGKVEKSGGTWWNVVERGGTW